MCVCLDGGKSKPLYSMKALSAPYRYESISLDFDTMYKLITASFSFCLQHNSVLVTFFQGTSLFVHALAVVSQFVQ